MNRYEMVVLVVALVIMGSLLLARFGARGQRPSHRRGTTGDVILGDDPEKQRLREEVRELKERVAVLERIATDSSASLSHEIEKLRDK